MYALVNSLVRYVPLWAHIFVYVLTRLIAATYFYFDYMPVVLFVEFFSGRASKRLRVATSSRAVGLIFGITDLIHPLFMRPQRFAYLLESYCCGNSWAQMTKMYQRGCRSLFLISQRALAYMACYVQGGLPN